MTIEYCEFCQFPLSQCGPPSVDGEPSLDCRLCKLQDRVTELGEDRDRKCADRDRWILIANDWRDKAFSNLGQLSKITDQLRVAQARVEELEKSVNEIVELSNHPLSIYPQYHTRLFAQMIHLAAKVAGAQIPEAFKNQMWDDEECPRALAERLAEALEKRPCGSCRDSGLVFVCDETGREDSMKGAEGELVRCPSCEARRAALTDWAKYKEET